MAAEHRTLRFESFDDAMAEAERLATSQTKTTGNFSLGQIFEHLARTLEVVTGDRQMPPPSFPMRVMSRMIRPLVLRKASPGFKLPSKAQNVLWPTDDVSTEAGWAHLQATAQKFRSEDQLPKHVFFGKMTRQQHNTLQARHFECHLGFVHDA